MNEITRKQLTTFNNHIGRKSSTTGINELINEDREVAKCHKIILCGGIPNGK